MNSLLKKLKEPFPEQENVAQSLKSSFFVALFVALFLYLLQPFGLPYYEGNKLILCASFGLITFSVSVIFNLFVNHVLGIKKDVPSWTLWKWIVEVVFLIITIGIANFVLMNAIRDWAWFGWSEVLYMIFHTFLVGIFPIIFSGMMIQMRANKNNQATAKDLQPSLQIEPPKNQNILLTSQNNQQAAEFNLNELLYVESMQNYVAIQTLKGDKTEKTVFRNTIKEMEYQLANTTMLRCHRSFIVNTDLIEKVTGNAQGLRLSLKGVEEVEVPVSRKYIATLKKVLQ